MGVLLKIMEYADCEDISNPDEYLEKVTESVRSEEREQGSSVETGSKMGIDSDNSASC